MINEIVNPYVVKKRKGLGLDSTQKALMIWDMFKGQMTDGVKSRLDALNILFVGVPANMTHLFQPLDITVNVEAKKVTRKEFVTYYSTSAQHQLQNGRKLEDADRS